MEQVWISTPGSQGGFLGFQIPILNGDLCPAVPLSQSPLPVSKGCIHTAQKSFPSVSWVKSQPGVSHIHPVRKGRIPAALISTPSTLSGPFISGILQILAPVLPSGAPQMGEPEILQGCVAPPLPAEHLDLWM